MAREIYEFPILTPVGVAKASPQIAQMTLPDRIVNRIEVLVPPGPSGELGFAIGAAGTPIIPANSGAWIISDDERIVWDVEDQIISGAWECISYNTGAFPHTIYIRFLAVLIPAPVSKTGGPIDPAQLAGSVPPPDASSPALPPPPTVTITPPPPIPTAV